MLARELMLLCSVLCNTRVRLEREALLVPLVRVLSHLRNSTKGWRITMIWSSEILMMFDDHKFGPRRGGGWVLGSKSDATNCKWHKISVVKHVIARIIWVLFWRVEGNRVGISRARNGNRKETEIIVSRKPPIISLRVAEDLVPHSIRFESKFEHWTGVADLGGSRRVNNH